MTRGLRYWAALFGIFTILSTTQIGVMPHLARAENAAGIAIEQELSAIRDLMRESQAAYKAGDHEQALRLARQAYLDHFELVEIPLRVADPNFTFAMEVKFAEWRQLIQQGAPADEIQRLLLELDDGLVEVERVIGRPGLAAPLFVSVASFTILFREGIEAILVIAALLGYLGVHQPTLRRPLWIGIALAIPASIATWVLLVVVLRLLPIGRELLEIAVSFLAVLLMISISMWLLRRLDTRRWLEYLRAHSWEAIATGKASAVALLGFTAIYREGAETAVLYQSLILMARRLELWVGLGLVAGAMVLLLLGWAIIGLGTRLPLRLFLSAAVLVIMLLSVAILGHAVWELQMIGYLPVTVIELPRLHRGVSDVLGLHPTRQVVLAQLILTATYAVAWMWAGWTWYGARRVRSTVHLSNS